MSSLLFLFTKYTSGREKRERPPRYRPHFSRVTRETSSKFEGRDETTRRLLTSESMGVDRYLVHMLTEVVNTSVCIRFTQIK